MLNKIIISSLLCGLSLALSPLVQAAKSVPQAKKPVNVLWIIAEDMSREQGAYGYHEQVSTPNIDALAKRGMAFDNVFTTAPICSTSRSAIMTGMYATSIGAHNHRTANSEKKMLPQGVQPISHWYEQAGYLTANVKNLTGDKSEKFYRGTGKTDWNFKFKGKAFQSSNWSDLKKKQPFYAQVNLAETHRMMSDWSRAHEYIQTPADPNRVKIPPYYPDHPGVKRDWANYLDSIMVLDKKVGFILNQLEQDGLADNTIVFFFSDHGQAMVRGKQWVYDSGLQIPLLIYVPESLQIKGYKAGSRSERLISGIDLSATSLAMSGLQVPEKMQGRPFLGQMSEERDYAFSARDRADESVEYIRSVRDKRFRYIKNFLPNIPRSQPNRYKENMYPPYNLMRSLYKKGELNSVQAEFWLPTKPTEELYDLENDPYETVNLAQKEGYQEVLSKYRAELLRWQDETNDQGRIPESEEVVRKWREKSINYFERDKGHLKLRERLKYDSPEKYK